MESEIGIGKKAPAWSSTAYRDGEEVRICSEDFSGKWYVLYWYPLDFTFVCPTEIKGFQELLGDFEDDGVAVIGASTDSFYTHKAWFADRETFPDAITHPVLADTGHQLEVSLRLPVLAETGIIEPGAFVEYQDGSVTRLGIVRATQVEAGMPEVWQTLGVQAYA